MKTSRFARVFTDRFPLLGPSIWILSIQYFVVQVVAALDWHMPGYSVLHNAISDLGNTLCGRYGLRLVCSPLHVLMNASFITLGLTMALGSLFIYQEFRESRNSLLGFSAMAVAGIGSMLVGFFPENSVSSLHLLGAALVFLVGNVGLVVLGASLALPRWLRRYTVASGVISLGALVLYMFHIYLGIGLGGMERIVAYPQTIWLILFGLYMSRNHYRRR